MSASFITNTVLMAVSFAATAALTNKTRAYLTQHALLDHPNERSSHSVAVPRGGGWALIAILLPGLFLTGVVQGNLAQHTGLLLGLVILIGISWQDDRKGVSAAKRLSLHILAACLGSLSFASNATLFGHFLPFWLDRTIMIIGWAWFMNLYNFMDGIDGITSAETIALSLGICLVMSAMGFTDPYISVMTLLMTGTCLGFLIYNWYPAKIFLGDVGSVPLGFLAAFGLLTLATQGYVVTALILPLYYLADSGITITKRALRHERIWQAHRQHFYQRASASLGRHDKVVYWITTCNCGLIIAALIAMIKPLLGLSISVVLVALLLRKMHKSTYAFSASDPLF